MKQINKFSGNIISDIDVSDIKGDIIVFPTVGIRVFNKAGKGLIATVVPGNVEFFDITEGFEIIGGCELEGVAYIFSLNQLTGEGEIGTYPTPNRATAGFSKYYFPLLNLGGGMPVAGNAPPYGPFPLRTTKFNFSIHHQVDVVAKKSYDNTVDLYFIDNYNPDRVINNGFKVTGESVPRYVYLSNFDGALNHVPFTNKEIKVNDVQVVDGGYLKPGNIYLYIRYLTYNYGKTNFVKEIGPLSIDVGNVPKYHVGYQEKNWTTGIDNVTNKRIDVNIDNLDPNFSYIQVGVVRYSATTENGPAQRDIWLIGNYYPISGTSSQFSIYGDEPQESLLYTEILKEPFPYPISKTQTQIEKRLLKANVKRSALSYKRDSLISFASKVVIGEFYHDEYFASTNINDAVNGGLTAYSVSENVYKYVGYFKDQVYPFACVFKFSDGTISEAFPCQGNLGQLTEKGLYKFADWATASMYGGSTFPKQDRITGVSFMTAYARDYYNNHKTDFADIVGFYFARADRIDNFICQGVSLHGYHGVAVTDENRSYPCSFQGDIQPDTHNIANNTTTFFPLTAAIIPLYRGYMPTVHEDVDAYYGYTDDYGAHTPPSPRMDYKPTGFDGYFAYNFSGIVEASKHQITLPARWDNIAGAYTESMFNSPNPYGNKHGIFCPDLLFDEGGIIVPTNAVVKPLFKFDAVTPSGENPYIITAARKVLPRTSKASSSIYGIDLNPMAAANAISLADDLISSDDIKVSATRVEHLQGKGNLNFTSHLTGDGVNIGFVAFSHIWNRDIGTSAYIGVEDISTDKTMRGLYAKYNPSSPYNYNNNQERTCIVSVYKNTMDSDWIKATNDSFGTTFTQYNIISELVTFDDINNFSSMYQCFKGDCFLQKVWFRTHRWYNISHNNNSDAQNSICSSTQDGYARNFIDKNCYWYQHGFMIGVTVECRYNAGMRNNVIAANTTDKYLEYTFFPKCMVDGITIDQFIAIEAGKYMEEALQINSGYNKVKSDKTYKGYDVTQPVFEQNKPNRVYASDAHIAGAFLDGYRSIQDNSYQDFAIEDGDINYIGKNMSKAFIVQRNGTNQIFFNEEVVGQTNQGQDVILGTSLTFFSDKIEKIGWFGTQHKSSITNGTRGTYGYDFIQNVWWKINTERMLSGGARLVMEDVSGRAFIQDELTKLSDAYSPYRDASDDLPDDPLSGCGIVAYADIDNEEIGMTFLLPIPTYENGHLMRTIIFSEKIDGYRGDYPFAEHLYLTLGNMLFSQHSRYKNIGVGFDYITDNRVYLYNQKVKADGTPNFATFFGNKQQTKISFIINGVSEKESAAELVKIINSLDIEMANVPLSSITFTTQYQEGYYSFGSSDFWNVAEYLEHKWHVPVIIQTSADNDAYETTSELRGIWIKVTLVYEGDQDIELKSVISDFDISYD